MLTEWAEYPSLFANSSFAAVRAQSPLRSGLGFRDIQQAVARQMQRRARDRLAGNEAPARHVIARIEAVEAEPHAFQFFGPIGLERFLSLLALAPRSFLREQAIERRIGGKSFGMFLHGRTEGGADR